MSEGEAPLRKPRRRSAQHLVKMQGGKRRFVYLDEATTAAAKRFGEGNMSEGIRRAVAAFAEQQGAEKQGL